MAENYQKIVAGMALQSETHPAVARAAQLADEMSAELRLMHVVTGSVPDAEAEMDRAQREFEDLRKLYPSIEHLGEVVSEQVSSIGKAAFAAQADLLVVGTHVHGRLRRLFGVNADQILHEARSDTLAVKSDRDDDTTPQPYRKILAALDLKEGSQEILARAAHLAQHFDAELRVTHVVEHFPTDRENQDITPEDRDPNEYQQEVSLQRLSQMVEDLGLPDVLIETPVVSGAAVDEVVRLAHEGGMDLLVIGAGRRHMLSRLFESAADSLIEHAPCDVLVIRNAGPVTPTA